MYIMKRSALFFIVTFLFTGSQAMAVTIYDPGLAPAAGSSGLTFGDHLVSPQAHPSVPGVGGSGISNAGDALNGSRTFTFDRGAQPDLTDGVANRGDAGFAMLIWDMETPFDSIRLYTHQDHFSGGPITTNFVAQDVMEYSVWGSNDGDDFELLSDVIGFDINGGGAGLPTYTFAGADPSVVYRGGSPEFGITNAYTREYVFGSTFQFYGVRTSQISLTIPGGGIDADPEIDAIGGFNIGDRPPGSPGTDGVIPEPTTLSLLGMGAAGLALFRRRRKNTS